MKYVRDSLIGKIIFRFPYISPTGKLFERPSLVTAVAPINYETGMLRTGLIGVKQGETNLFLRNGKEEVGTMISIFPNYVLSAKPYYGNRDGILSERKEFLQTVASVDVDQVDELSLPYQKYFYAAGVAPKKFIREFVVTEENILPVGYQLDASHLFAGQYVDVTAKTIDRGFQGVIRRWGYKGQGHCAGRTKTHRRPGSIGTQGLRKVMKGKNLPGWMGNKLRTHLAYKVMYANYERGYIIVNGTTPGPVGGEVFLEDCKVKSSLQAEYLHYPTFLLEGKLLKEHYDGVIVSPNEPTAGLLK